jgi:hypothetical protein
MRKRILLVLCSLAFGLVLFTNSASAATNKGSGDIAGVTGDLGDSNQIDLTTTALALIKKAFLTDGTPVPTGTALPKGTIVKFMIYINNETSVGVTDVSVEDVLAATFAYQTGTIKVDNSVNKCALTACTPAEEAAVFAAVNVTTALNDSVDGTPTGDVASYTAATTTIDVGNQHVANKQLDIPAGKVWAVLFTVKMQ